MTAQKHTLVPYRYRARLERTERIGATKGHTAEHHMHLRGTLHPDPHTHAAATELAQNKLQPFLNQGWRLTSLVVNAYGEEDA
jgi:hypothetical protein